MKKLTAGQIAVLILATLPMIAVGIGGAIGTYANAASVLHRKETALGVVAAGEGATLVAALVMIGVTMLGQPAPLAMTAAAEGISFLARRIVVHATGTDIEAQRRNAAILRRIAYHQARAQRHPWKRVRKISELLAWRLIGRLGHGDATLGSALTDVQNTRVVAGADVALAAMLGSAPELPAVAPPVTPATRRPPVAPHPATPKPPRSAPPADTATPPATESATPTGDGDEPRYEPGTPQHVVRELWLRLSHRPTEGQIVEALGAAELPNSRAQAGKIRRQVESEDTRLPGPRAA